MRKFVYFLALMLSACSSDSDDHVKESISDSTLRYFTITNGDNTHILDVGINQLAPGDVSDVFTMVSDSTEIRCWWYTDNSDREFFVFRVNMKDKPYRVKENYTLKYEYSDN